MGCSLTECFDSRVSGLVKCKKNWTLLDFETKFRICSPTFGVGEGLSAVQLAQEYPPVLGLRVQASAIQDMPTQPHAGQHAGRSSTQLQSREPNGIEKGKKKKKQWQSRHDLAEGDRRTVFTCRSRHNTRLNAHPPHACPRSGVCSEYSNISFVTTQQCWCYHDPKPRLTVNGTYLLLLLTSVSGGTPAVQFAQEGPPVLGLPSTAVPGVGVQLQLASRPSQAHGAVSSSPLHLETSRALGIGAQSTFQHCDATCVENHQS